MYGSRERDTDVHASGWRHNADHCRRRDRSFGRAGTLGKRNRHQRRCNGISNANEHATRGERGEHPRIDAVANASANLTVNSPLSVSKAYSPTSLRANQVGAGTLTFTLTNSHATQSLTGVAFSEANIWTSTTGSGTLTVTGGSTTCSGGSVTPQPRVSV